MTLLAAVLFAATFARPMERISTTDPALAQSVYDSQVAALLYETPLRVDYAARPYRLVPGFCELPEVSEDGLVYTFRVREGGVRPAGAPFGAHDMVRSLERLRDPKLISPNGWMLKDVEVIRALDERQVEIRLKRRCHFFPWLMAMSASGVRNDAGEGSGPYRLVRWRKNHEMVFRRSDYLAAAPANGFDEIRYLVVDDASTRWLMLLKGEIDFLDNISRDNWAAAVDGDGQLVSELAEKGLRLCSTPTFDVFYLGINMRDGVLGKNRKLRQALNAAFDFPAWRNFHCGRVAAAGGPVPPGVEGRLETPFAYDFDLVKARRLMAEAGYANGIDPQTGRRLVLTLTLGRATQESREAGELLVSFFARIGVKLELSFLTWTAFLKAVNDGRVQLFQMGWVGDYPDAQNFLQLFYSKNVTPGPNHAHYTSEVFDRAYEAALAAPSPSERLRLFGVCQEIVREDCPWVFLHVKGVQMLVRKSVGNFCPSAFPYGNEEFYENALP